MVWQGVLRIIPGKRERPETNLSADFPGRGWRAGSQEREATCLRLAKRWAQYMVICTSVKKSSNEVYKLLLEGSTE